MLSESIKTARVDAGKGVRELSREIGLSPSYLSDIETGKRIPPPDTIRKIAAALGQEPESWLHEWAEQTIDPETLDVIRYAARLARRTRGKENDR